MDYTIVYKTYESDLKWLYYSLASVNKFVDDAKEVIIYYHNKCEGSLKALLKTMAPKIPYRTIPVEYDIHGYLKQQVVKCNSYKDVTTPYILFIDCDVIFRCPYSPTILIDPETHKNRWYFISRTSENQNKDFFVTWPSTVERLTKEPMREYFMYNHPPFLFRTDTLRLADEYFKQLHGCDYNEYCLNGMRKWNLQMWERPLDIFVQKLAPIFTEFEYLAWYAKYKTNDYLFLEGDSPNKEATNWAWSHGGLSLKFEDQLYLRLFA